MIFGDLTSSYDQIEPISENYVINKNDLEVNVDDFKNGKSNVLLITGLSGSGKSTLGESMAKKYHAEYVELDFFEMVYCFKDDDEKLKECSIVFYDYFMKHKDLREKLNNKELRGDKLNAEITKFVKYCLSYANSHKDQKFVFEGVQIYSVYHNNASPIKKYPIIIKGTSALTSFVRMLKRSYNSDKDNFKSTIKELPQCIAWYFEDEATLKKFTKSLMKKSAINEGLMDVVAGKPKTYYVVTESKLSSSNYDKQYLDDYATASTSGAIKRYCSSLFRIYTDENIIYHYMSKKSYLSKKVYLYKYKSRDKVKENKEFELVDEGTLENVAKNLDIKFKEFKDFDNRKKVYSVYMAAAKTEYAKCSSKFKSKVKFGISDKSVEENSFGTITSDSKKWLEYDCDYLAIFKLDNATEELGHEWQDFGKRILNNCWDKLPDPQRYRLNSLSQEGNEDNLIMTIELYGGTSMERLKESAILEADDDFEEPDAESNDLIDVKELLDNTDPKRIFMSSDWHFFKNHYKHEANYVNTQKIVTWCRQNIKDDDVFMYLGDISFRYANTKDKEESQRIMASLPGHKILILGNHDIMAGSDYYSGCGFDYVFESLEWNNILFTHIPRAMEAYPDPTTINIHGHIHTNKTYNTTDGKRNINVYPYFYNNKPVTLDYCLKNKDKLVADNTRSDWTNMGESVLDLDTANTLSGVKQLVYENAQTENASSVLFSPDINANTIAYMVSAYKDRLPGNVAIKLHVGEEGNDNYLSPRLVSSLAKTFRATLVDSTVAYKSTKQTVEGHMKMAEEHGFTKVANFDVLDAEGGMELAIPSANRIKKALVAGPDNELGIPSMSKGPHLESIDVGSHLSRYDSMIVFSHFKGHSMAGFGGAIKNIGMGIPTGKKGKLQIHGQGEWQWGPDFLERLAESASAIQDYFDGNIVFVNVLANISSKCDCEADAPKSKMPNIGVLVSSDPIALEQASLDFVRNCKGNKEVMDMISSRGGTHQIEYGEWLGMGTRKYKLYDLNKNRLKLESTYINEMKRSKLPDSSFGIPEDRKYPLDTKQHVQSAIKLFGHAEESKKKALAHRIKTAADKYDIKIPETTQCYKYLNESADYLISDKIKNVVFDLGSVIVDAHTMDVLLDSADIPKEHAKEIYDLVTKKMLYEKDEYATNFLHTCSIEQAMEFFKNVAPKHLKMYVKPVFKLFSKAMYQMDYVDDLISTLRAKGYSIYYLSNWDKYTYELEENFFKGVLNKFDGGLFSFEVAKQKPDPEIYKIFLNKFGLEASECIFYDDKPENVEAAKSVGMDAVIFDKETTPYELIGCYDIDFSDLENTFIAGGDEVKPFDIRQLNKWHISSSRHPYSISPDGYYPSIEEAIQRCVIDNDFINGPIQRFVFTCNDDDSSEFNRMIPIGNILVSPDRTYKWQIQYPLNIKNGKLTTCIEWAMAACNPIQGIAKPFILKTGSDCDTLDTAEFAFSPDIISDKYLVVNENAQLQIVDSSYFDGRLVEEYEYVGNRFNIRKIAEAYKSKAIVDTTYFYTALTGKPMLTEDQIDFDKSFKKVDFELMKETALSTAATRRDEIIEAMGYKTSKLPIEESFILENVPFMRRYNKNERTFIIKEDFDGYYFFNLLNHKRTASVVSSDLLTETMIKSIL